jgi:hypothetical protein
LAFKIVHHIKDDDDDNDNDYNEHWWRYYFCHTWTLRRLVKKLSLDCKKNRYLTSCSFKGNGLVQGVAT